MRLIIVILLCISPKLFANPIKPNEGFPVKEELTVTESDSTDITATEEYRLLDYMILELIRREGLHEIVDYDKIVPYNDPAGPPAIGIGHCRGTIPKSITFSQAFEIAFNDIQDFYNKVKDKYPNLNRQQTLAIAMTAHNMGIGAFGTNLNKELSNGDDPRTLLKYVKCCGGKASSNLIKARIFEYTLFKADTVAINRLHNLNKLIESQKYERYSTRSRLDIQRVRSSLQKARESYTLLEAKSFQW